MTVTSGIAAIPWRTLGYSSVARRLPIPDSQRELLNKDASTLQVAILGLLTEVRSRVSCRNLKSGERFNMATSNEIKENELGNKAKDPWLLSREDRQPLMCGPPTTTAFYTSL